MTTSEKPGIDLLGLDMKELEAILAERGIARFRAAQIFAWIHKRAVSTFEEMTDIAKGLRTELEGIFEIEAPSVEKKSVSTDGTVKYLLRMSDGEAVECVLIPSRKHLTLCISTQVGCALGCRFCRTAQMGFVRNLTVSEILGQIYTVCRDLPEGTVIRNVVAMGMGEPLENLNAVVRSIRTICHPKGLNLSPRRITLSTAGVIQAFDDLPTDPWINLAVSLNGATDKVRASLMPINRRYPIVDLIKALGAIPLPKRSWITIEYILIAGINDSTEQARALARILRPLRCKINLIAFNEFPGSEFKRPSPEAVEAFRMILVDKGYNALQRESRGSDISAACGMLTAEG
ncbi:23S rRNA (adenine(2503)-C(2))-methyltransferase RlmN [Thermodesulfobacteriota bacterium]